MNRPQNRSGNPRLLQRPYRSYVNSKKPEPPKKPEEIANLGRSLWTELHLRALRHKGGDDSAFIRNFSNKIPRYMKGCSCNEFWKQWIRKNPPVFDVDKDQYFAWTVRAHNAVNMKLNKQQISVEEAKRIFSNM